MVFTEDTCLTVVAEDNHGMLFNGSNITMTHGVMRVHFSGLDWEYSRPQNGLEYLTASGHFNEDVTVAVSGIPILCCVNLVELLEYFLKSMMFSKINAHNKIL